MRQKGTDDDLAALARRQAGVVTSRQLQDLGFDSSAIRRRARAGRLHPLYRGVWAVGHTAIGRPARLNAAVLACGPGAALGIYAAAEWWALREIRPSVIDVMVPGQRGRKIDGVRAHETRDLRATRHRGIPITTVARTLADLANRSSDRMVERDLDNAKRLGLLSLAAIETERGPGSGKLRKVVADHTAGSTWTRNEFEEALLTLMVELQLDRPIANHPVGPYVVDFYWPDRKLAVETDGRATHLTPGAFEADRERDAYLWTVHGIHTMRFTYRGLTTGRARTGERLRAALA